MRTTLNIEESLLSDVLLQTGKKNKSEAVRFALREYIKQTKIKQLLSLRGEVDIEDNWQELRNMELSE